MPGEPVHIDWPPFTARLVAWGRAGDGWWGLVHWPQTIRRERTLSTMTFAAWLPAASIRAPGWAGDRKAAVSRLALPPDPADWPRPVEHATWYAGAWRDGPIPTPDGVEVDNGPAWRQR